MKHLIRLVTTLIFFLGHFLMAQNNKIILEGEIHEKGNSPIPFATVVLINSNNDKVISGTTSDEKGKFRMQSPHKNIYLKISFMGFKTKTIKDIKIINNKAILGIIHLQEDAQALEEVVVRAEKSTTEFKLDRKVFNIGKDISSTGVSALEVLNNVPSVNVNIEGEISLRGSTGVQILIDGKPSVLTSQGSNALGTITAEMIKSIEVITNPSAKYDAEGTSGILNIILKKEEKKGLNGSISVNTGVPNNHSIGLSLNRRSQKFNLFTQMGIGYRSLPRNHSSENKDLIKNTILNSEGAFSKDEVFYNITLGADYHINKNEVLTLSGNFAYEVEDQPSRTDYLFLKDNELQRKWYREEEADGTNPKWSYELNYKKIFNDNEDHTLLFSALGRFFGKRQFSEFKNKPLIGSDNIENNQQTKTKFQQEDYTFKLDYTNPITEQFTIETGAQYVSNDVGNDYSVNDYINNIWKPNASLTNNFEYDQKVLGVYATTAYEEEKWGIKAGLRAEKTNLKTLLTNTNESNKRDYTDWFPSVHTSYKVSEWLSFQAGYSKRIFRPRLWNLNPFFNIKNNYSIRVGNPNLQPEYTDSYEFTNIFKIGRATLNASIYHRFTTDIVERVVTFENNVTISKPLNIGTNAATGFEINGRYSPSKWLSFNGDFNVNAYKRRGNYEEQSFDFSSKRWSSRLTTKIKAPSDIDVEISGKYQSEYQTVQSNIKPSGSIDIGLRKKMLKGKAVISLSVRDLFETQVYGRSVSKTDYHLNFEGKRGRFITLGFSYGFGKGEAMTYSGRRRR